MTRDSVSRNALNDLKGSSVCLATIRSITTTKRLQRGPANQPVPSIPDPCDSCFAEVAKRVLQSRRCVFFLLTFNLSNNRRCKVNCDEPSSADHHRVLGDSRCLPITVCITSIMNKLHINLPSTLGFIASSR